MGTHRQKQEIVEKCKSGENRASTNPFCSFIMLLLLFLVLPILHALNKWCVIYSNIAKQFPSI